MVRLPDTARSCLVASFGAREWSLIWWLRNFTGGGNFLCDRPIRADGRGVVGCAGLEGICGRGGPCEIIPGALCLFFIVLRFCWWPRRTADEKYVAQSLVGGRFDFQYRAQIPVNAGEMQISAAAARTFKSCFAGVKHMVTLVAHEPAIQLRHHRPELNTRNAIRATNNFVIHNDSGPEG